MSTALTFRQPGALALDVFGEQIRLVKDILAKPAQMSDLELDFFAAECRRRGLDPFARQIYAIRYKAGGPLTIQVSIDGFRLVAERTGKYAGQLGPYWCGEDGEWRDVWLEDAPPSAARVGVLRHDFKEPLWGTARWESYGKTKAERDLWKGYPDIMLAKCAESLALRRAFPQELSGIYSSDEMPTEEIMLLPVGPAVPEGDLEGERQASEAPRGPSVSGIRPRPQPTAQELAGRPAPKPATAAPGSRGEKPSMAAITRFWSAVSDAGCTSEMVLTICRQFGFANPGEMQPSVLDRLQATLLAGQWNQNQETGRWELDTPPTEAAATAEAATTEAASHA